MTARGRALVVIGALGVAAVVGFQIGRRAGAAADASSAQLAALHRQLEDAQRARTQLADDLAQTREALAHAQEELAAFVTPLSAAVKRDFDAAALARQRPAALAHLVRERTAQLLTLQTSAQAERRRLEQQLTEARRAHQQEAESLRRRLAGADDAHRQWEAQRKAHDRLQGDLRDANDRIAELLVALDVQEQITTPR